MTDEAKERRNTEREQRLANALRENLRRRKAQARGRIGGGGEQAAAPAGESAAEAVQSDD
jgi:hypothetical protein